MDTSTHETDPMAEPKSYRFPEDLIDKIEEHIAPNGRFASRTGFFVEAAVEKLMRLDAEEAQRPPVPFDVRYAEIGCEALPFFPATPQGSDGTIITLFIGPDGWSEPETVTTDPDARVMWRFQNVHAELLDEPAPLIMLNEVKIGGSACLLPFGPAPATQYQVPERSSEGATETAGLRDFPLLRNPNRAQATVRAAGRPGQVVRFRLNVVAEEIQRMNPASDVMPGLERVAAEIRKRPLPPWVRSRDAAPARPTLANDTDYDLLDEVLLDKVGEAERAKLDVGECPKCDGIEVSRTVDPRQGGDKGGRVGRWVNYRCPCGFARDYVE